MLSHHLGLTTAMTLRADSIVRRHSAVSSSVDGNVPTLIAWVKPQRGAHRHGALNPSWPTCRVFSFFYRLQTRELGHSKCFEGT